MNYYLHKHLQKTAKKEARLSKSTAALDNKTKDISTKIGEKIPPTLKNTLETAFYKGFKMLFDKGTNVLELTYDKAKLTAKYQNKDRALRKRVSTATLKSLDKKALGSSALNTGIATLEGGALGLLGIGLPDIPILMGFMLKNIYQTALNYGFDYRSDEERYYILLLICGALEGGEAKKHYGAKIDQTAAYLNKQVMFNYDLEKQIRLTAKTMSGAMLTSKFIQGIPVVGVVGGVANFAILQRISAYCQVKYKQRFLNAHLAALKTPSTTK